MFLTIVLYKMIILSEDQLMPKRLFNPLRASGWMTLTLHLNCSDKRSSATRQKPKSFGL